jgi:hypothetical protein
MGLFDNADDKMRDMKDKLSGSDDDRKESSASTDNSDMSDDMSTGSGSGMADDRLSGTRMQDDDLTDADRDINLRREYTDSDDTM